MFKIRMQKVTPEGPTIHYSAEGSPAIVSTDAKLTNSTEAVTPKAELSK